MVCPAGQGFDVYLVGDLRDCEGSVCVSLRGRQTLKSLPLGSIVGGLRCVEVLTMLK
jgi:hypothetical protein